LRRPRHELDFAGVRSISSILSPAYSYFTQPCLWSCCIDIGTLARFHGSWRPPATETMFLPLSTKRGELLRPLHDLLMRATNTQHPVLPIKSCHIVGELAVRWGGRKGTSRAKWPGSSVTPDAIPASALKHFSDQRKLASGRVRREARSHFAIRQAAGASLRRRR
jgi:hypothetical protein